MKTFCAAMKVLMAMLYIAAGINHFLNPQLYLRIMPPYLPWPMFLQYLAGFFEIVFGVLLLFPKYTRLAAWGVIVLLIAVYPANIHMAVNSHLYPDWPAWLYWVRLPLQFVLIAWAWWYTREDLAQGRKDTKGMSNWRNPEANSH
jgi:uncharacterized membrane protein